MRRGITYAHKSGCQKINKDRAVAIKCCAELCVLSYKCFPPQSVCVMCIYSEGSKCAALVSEERVKKDVKTWNINTCMVFACELSD